MSAPDPGSAEFRALAAQFGELAVAHVQRVFAWIHDELASSGTHGAVAFILALADHQDDGERAPGLILSDLLLAADRHMPCQHAERSGAR